MLDPSHMLQKLASEISAITDATQRQSTTLEVVHRHKKMAPESGVKFMPLMTFSGVCIRGLTDTCCTAEVGLSLVL